MSAVRHVDAAEAQALVERGGIQVVDVRTPDEHERLGHIFGSRLLPVALMAAAPAVLDRDGSPVLVYCEHGMRSRAASDFLARAGFSDVLNLAGGMSTWRGARQYGPTALSGPSSWLVENQDVLRGRSTALDVAAGRGRHALVLAAAGMHVRAIDVDAARMAELSDTAARLDLPVDVTVKNLEEGDVDLGAGLYDLIVVMNYLHRPLFPALVRAIAPGGLLLYETFTVRQIARGRPTNRAFLLEPGELSSLVGPLVVLRARGGDYDGHMISAVVAQRT
jgi:rhodanese-related sulfurtransferase